MKKALQKAGIEQKILFVANEGKSVTTEYQWVGTFFTIKGSVKMNQDGTMDFTVNNDQMKEDEVLTYEENWKGIHKEILRAFKNAIKDYLTQYCIKVRKNESEATTERMLIDHRRITVNGKEYYISRVCDGEIIQDYLYENFQI